jgi:hypothetical protein
MNNNDNDISNVSNDHDQEQRINDKDVSNAARLPAYRWNCVEYESGSLHDVTFPELERALAVLMADIEANLVLLRSGDYYKNPPHNSLSFLLKAASNIVFELEFRKACYWTF